MTVSDEQALVTALLAVDGVADAVLEPDAHSPGSLRLQLVPGADEIAVAGAVNRLLRSRFGLAVDADRVRVLDEPATVTTPTVPPAEPEDVVDVTVDVRRPAPDPAQPAVQPVPGPEPAPEFHLARPGRLTIEKVQLLSAGLGVETTVTLGLEGRTYEGTASGAATTTSVHRSAALATLHAVEAVLGNRARFEVEHVELATAGSDRTVLVVVTMLTGRGNEQLSGASVVREDVRQAVIRAVLAAVNRRLELMFQAP